MPKLVAVEMSGETIGRFKRLCEKIGGSAKVFRRALAVYDLILKERDCGSVVILRRPDGVERVMLLD